MMSRLVLLGLLLGVPVQAGVYYSGETPGELPSQWRGFLVEHRALRLASATPAPGLPASPLREQYQEQAKKLHALPTRTVEQTADLAALYLRLGQPAKAIDLLRPTQRQHTDHFRIATHLGTAWQMQGDLNEAVRMLEEAVRLAPARSKPAEELQLKWARLRQKEAKNATGLDDLFAGLDRKKLPANDVALVQQLALWFPADARLLWLLGELCALHGDTRTAASILEGCVTEMGLTQPRPRERRQQLRTAADAIAKLPDAEHAKYKGDIVFRSTRPLVRAIDQTTFPAIRPDGVNPLPWLAINETVIDKPFQPRFLKYLEQLDGKKVSMSGYMQPLTMDIEVAGFLLVEHPVGCWFCETPEPTAMLYIEVAGSKAVPVKRGRIKVEGTLSLNKNDPEDFLYTLKATRVSEPD